MTGKVVRLRPVPRRFDWTGADLGEADYLWRVAAADDGGLDLEFERRRIGVPESERLVARVPNDHVKSYMSDPATPNGGFLLLLSEVQLQQDGPGGTEEPHLEPLHPHPKVATRKPGPTVMYRLVSSRLNIRRHEAKTELSEKARTLLLEAAQHHSGMVMTKRPLGDLMIIANEKQFVTQDDPRSRAAWEDALEELIGAGLIRDNGHGRGMFVLTTAGFRYADKVRSSA